MRNLVEKLVDGRNLTEDESRSLLMDLTDGDLDPLLAVAALIALRTKGETADELRGFVLGLRELSLRPEIPPGRAAVDVVGTGGDGSGSLNLSTGSALLAAAAGVPVCKHGNRSVSSRSGSADVLEALGMGMSHDRAVEMFERIGFCFLFAPMYHPAMRAIAPVRKALGIRTLFNLAGPLANPATPAFQVVGACNLETARIMAETLAGMPIRRAFVIHGAPGWDEVTPVGPYHLFDVAPGSITETVEDPTAFAIPRCEPADLIGSDPAHNAQRIRDVFAGEIGPHRDALILGASLALRVTGVPPAEALARAEAAIDEGRAARLLAGITEKAHV